MNKRIIIILIVVSMLVGAGGMIMAAEAGVGGAKLLSGVELEEYENSLARYDKLTQLLDYVKTGYYKEVDEAILLEGAYAGIFEALDDPYSEYVSANNAGTYLEDMTLEFGGIGMAFYMGEDGYVFVDSVYLDSPADRAGIKAGDTVTTVDGNDVKDLDADTVKNMVRGAVGTVVEITYVRDGLAKTVKITRDIISETTVASTMINKDTVGFDANLGYIQIAAFGGGTAADFAKELNAFEEKKVDGLIIDLRNNGGGLVDSAVAIADMLMNKGTVVYAEAQNGDRTYYTTEDGRTKLPYVLLVNEYSASATEILATGVQCNNEGKVVGTVTFGKGIIQNAVELGDGSAVKMTILQYYSPNGEPIHKIGLTPEYVVELPAPNENGEVEDAQLLKAIELLQ